MEGAIVIGLAGIGATLLGTLLAPLLTGRLQRAKRRIESWIARLDANVDLLETAGHLYDNAQTS